MNLKGAELENKIQQIKKLWEERGGTVHLDAKDIYDSRQHSYWYEGNIGTIDFRGHKIYIDVRGEMVAKLRDGQGEEIASTLYRQKGKAFFHAMYPYIKDDSTLLEMSENHSVPNTTEFSLGILADNWIEYAVEDSNGDILTDNADVFLNATDVLEAFIEVEKLCRYMTE